DDSAGFAEPLPDRASDGQTSAQGHPAKRKRRWLWPVVLLAALLGPAVGDWLTIPGSRKSAPPAAERQPAKQRFEETPQPPPKGAEGKKAISVQGTPQGKEPVAPKPAPQAVGEGWVGSDPPRMFFSLDAKGQVGVVRQLRLRPN